MSTERNKYFMEIALQEAQEGYKRGDFPVGAALVIDDILVGKGNNSTLTNTEWVSHAESSLIRAHAPLIQRAKKDEKTIAIYTTLEPCLMCLGTISLNRIDKVVFACPDPNGGATSLDVSSLSPWYQRKWPRIEDGLLREESYSLLVDYMRQYDSWKKVLAQFEEMHKRW